MGAERIRKFQRGIKEVDGYLLNDPIDLFYLTGLTVSKGRLWISAEEAHLFVDGRYVEAAKRGAPCSVSLEREMGRALKGKRRIGFDSSYLTVDGWEGWQRELEGVEWVPVAKPAKRLRMRKEPCEIEALRRAGRLSQEGYLSLLPQLKEGVKERHLAWAFEQFCRERGASRLSFEPIIAFGEHGAYPHYRAGEAEWKEGEAALIDVGCVVEGYAGDLTRMVLPEGVPSKLSELHGWVKRAQEAAMARVRPGAKAKEIDEAAREVFLKGGVEKLFVHTLGHGVGLETHEFPRIRSEGGDGEVVLEEGMVFTIEPGLYQPGLGGVRLEETLAVTKNGYEILTSS